MKVLFFFIMLLVLVFETVFYAGQSPSQDHNAEATHASPPANYLR